MRDTVYIPFIMFQVYFQENHFEGLVEQIREFNTPDGIEIISVQKLNDPFIQMLLEQVKSLNPTEDCDKVCDSPEYLMSIEFEVDNPIHFTNMPWFEDQVTQYIRDNCYGMCLYYFYLINDGKEFRSKNVAVTDRGNGLEFFHDDEDDDMSFIEEAAPFLSHYWYRNDEVNVTDAYPAEAAKYLLLFDLENTNHLVEFTA